jgi:hypothetical protein
MDVPLYLIASRHLVQPHHWLSWMTSTFLNSSATEDVALTTRCMVTKDIRPKTVAARTKLTAVTRPRHPCKPSSTRCPSIDRMIASSDVTCQNSFQDVGALHRAHGGYTSSIRKQSPGPKRKKDRILLDAVLCRFVKGAN